MVFDANNLYGRALSEPLPFDEIKFDRIVELKDTINTPNDWDIDYLVQVDLKYPVVRKQKPRLSPLLLKIRKLILIISDLI